MIHGRLFRVHARPAAGDAIVAARQPVDRAVGCGEGLGASHVPASIAKPVAGARRGTDIGSQTGHRVQFVALVEHAIIAVSNQPTRRYNARSPICCIISAEVEGAAESGQQSVLTIEFGDFLYSLITCPIQLGNLRAPFFCSRKKAETKHINHFFTFFSCTFQEFILSFRKIYL